MDKLLRGIFDSSHPEALKEILIQRMLNQIVTYSSDDCCNILQLTMLLVTTTDNPFVERMCLTIFKKLSIYAREYLEELVTEQFLDNLLLSDAYPNKVAVFKLLIEMFKILHDSPKSESLFEQMRNRSTLFVGRAGSLQELRIMCQLLLLWPACLPTKENSLSALAGTIVKIIASVVSPPEPSEAATVFFEVKTVTAVFDQILSCLEKQTVIEVLRMVYILVSCRENEPSTALAAVVQCFPVSLSPQVVAAVVTDMSVDDSVLCLAVQRMICWLTWPADMIVIANWILALFNGLALASKFSVLIMVTRTKIDIVTTMLEFPGARDGSFEVLKHMLLSYQHSPDAFHKIVNEIPRLVRNWVVTTADDKILLLSFIDLIHTMIHLHTGFPDLYDPILAVLDSYPKPTVQKMNSMLQESKWPVGRTDYSSLHSSCAPRSDTGKTGLVNMGNTCYMNSVLQTLYMTDEFRNAVLNASPYPQQFILGKLQRLFAFLTHTERAAIGGTDFYEASRPPWFETGRQQDCSEYMRHLLDVLHEQELSVHSPVGPKKLGLPKTTSLSSSSKKVNPLARSKATKRKNSSQEMSTCDNGQWCEPLENGMDVDWPTQRKSLVHYTFAGKLVTSYKCLTCTQISESAESFIDLHLAFPSHARHNRATRYQVRQASKHATSINDDANGESSNHSNNGCLCLDDLVDYYLRPELLEGENKYFCNNCNGLSNAERSIRIVETPRYLILTLLRFSYDSGTSSRSKILTEVQYPMVLNLPISRMSEDCQSNTLKTENCEPSNQKNEDEMKRDKFLLYAVVMHSGMSSDGGHYYACARHSTKVGDISTDAKDIEEDPREWCMFNDSHVSYCNYKSFGSVTKRFPKDTAYVLLYRKMTTDSNEANQPDIDPKLVPLENEILDAVEKDNMHFQQEKAVEAKISRQRRGNSKPLYSWRDFDDSNPPGSCGSGGGGGFSSLASGNVARFVC